MATIYMETGVRKNRWFFGGISSGAAVIVTHPLDMIKVHLQTQQIPQQRIRGIIIKIYENGGIQGFYRGGSAAIMRQLTYTNARFGIYESGKQYIDTNSVLQSVSLAGLAGLIGGCVGVPFDVVNVRMQNDMKLPPEQRRKYRNVLDGIKRITHEEGIHALTSGATAAIGRGMVMTIGQNYSYDIIKQFLLTLPNFKDNIVLHFSASTVAAGIATLFTQPLDVIKTRLMNAPKQQNATFVSVALEAAKLGPLGFFKGFLPAFMRLCPHTVITFLLMEQLRLHFGYI